MTDDAPPHYNAADDQPTTTSPKNEVHALSKQTTLPVYAPEPEKRCENAATTYNDVPWIFVFGAQLIALIAVGAYYYTKNAALLAVNNSNSSNNVGISTNGLAQMLVTIFLVSMASAALWLVILRWNARCMIWASLLFAPIAFVILGIAFLIIGSIEGAVILFIFTALQLIWLYFVRNRVRFAAALLNVAMESLSLYPWTYGVSMLSLIPTIGWQLIWTWAAVFTMIDVENTNSNLVQVAYAFLVLSFYWTAGVIVNVVHTTTSGVVADWYFRYPNESKNVTSRSFKRATTTSFGSICYGSFLVAVIRTLRQMAKNAQRRGNSGAMIIAACVVGCLLQCLGDILDYFTYYAYVHVAVYGKNFCESAKDTWSMFMHKGWTVVINDDLSGGAMQMAALFSAALTGLITGLVARAINVNLYMLILYVVLGVFVGFVFSLQTMTVVQSAISTTIVCYMEDPLSLKNTKEAQYNKLTEAYQDRYGSSFAYGVM